MFGDDADGRDDGTGGSTSWDGATSWQERTRGQRGEDSEGEGWERRLAAETTLRDALTDQAHTSLTAPADRLIAFVLIDGLDEAGYLGLSPGDVADSLGCAAVDVDRVLAVLRNCEPTGVFANSLADCLALQLAELNRLDPAMRSLLDNLDLLARRDLDRLLQVCGVDMADLKDMIAEIRALDPKPGLRFQSDAVAAIVPDVLMRAAPDGSWQLELNADTLPRVLVDRQYQTRIAGGIRNKADQEYLSDCVASANWLVKSLHQRAQTILKVSSEIVRQQDAFFRKGIEFLRPLILRDIADVIGMHESTVSRVTTNKFMSTPRGLFELKYFFSASISGTDGANAHSAEAVRHKIKALIDAEPPQKVLSDDRIVDILKSDGIDIARRTVAKYRESMHIPSSVQRRRQKALMAVGS